MKKKNSSTIHLQFRLINMQTDVLIIKCIDPNLYDKFDVKRGLRDRNTGKGVLTGLTEIGDVHSYETIDGKVVPVEGKLL